MQPVARFQLKSPAGVVGMPCQPGLFGIDGRPALSITTEIDTRAAIGRLLAAARVPLAHRAALADHLCSGVPIDPLHALSFADERRLQRIASRFPMPAWTGARSVMRERADRLLARARAMRQWPPEAHRALRSHRSRNGAFDLDSLPSLPSCLQPSSAGLLATAMEVRCRLYEALALPVRYIRRGSIHTVEALESFRVHFDFARRRVSLERMAASGWIGDDTSDVHFDAPLPSHEWCHCFATHGLPGMRAALGPAWEDAGLARAAIHWLEDVVRSLADQSGLLDEVRRQLREAYPVDPGIVALARSVALGPERSWARAHGYARVWGDEAALRRRIAESAQLAPVWALARSCKSIGRRADYGVLQRFLRRHGVARSGWRLLCRHGPGPLLPAHPRSAPCDLLALLCRNLRLLQRMQRDRPLPRALMDALLAPHWFAPQLDVDDLPGGMLNRAVGQVETLDSGRIDDFIEGEFVPVLGWFARARPAIDPNQARAPWAWYRAQYRSWNEREWREREGRTWTHGAEALRWRAFEAVPIRDSATLWNEGEAMRNCLARYEDSCLAGRYLVYSIRTREATRSAADVGIAFDTDGTPSLQQVAGFANAAVHVEIARLAARLVKVNARR